MKLPSGSPGIRCASQPVLSGASHPHEGVFTQEVERHEGSDVETIRFTFERFSDYLRAQRLLAEIDPADLEGSFQREPLVAYFGPEASWRFAGVVEALAVQFPEQFGCELFDALPKGAIDDPSLGEAFASSLAWRTPKAFTQRTVGWVSTLCQLTGRSSYGLLLLVCTEPENQFNAEWLHQDLWQRPMPQRDAVWSVFLAEDDLSEGGAVETLIDWAWLVDAGEVDEQRLWLAAVALTWFLSTSNRAVRDRATKALVNLLSSKLSVGAALLDKFVDVDDLYISERLLAACYGAVMQGVDRAGCETVASAVWANHFAGDRTPPLHLLARDYALGILLYAQAAGQLPQEVDIEAGKAKFTSPWPLEPVPDEDLKEYRKKGYGDSIFSSTDEHGDFGNYTLRAWLHDIMSLPRVLAGQTTQRLYEAWQTDFEGKCCAERRRCASGHGCGWHGGSRGCANPVLCAVRRRRDAPDDPPAANLFVDRACPRRTRHLARQVHRTARSSSDTGAGRPRCWDASVSGATCRTWSGGCSASQP